MRKLGVAALLMLGCFGLFWLWGPELSRGARGRSAQSELSPEELFSRVSPAVVRIVVRERNRSTPFKQGEISGTGSGFLLSSDARRGPLLVTSYHVVRDSASVEVLRTDNTKLKVGDVMWSDPDADLSVLQILETYQLPVLSLGPDTLPNIGTKVYAIANPIGLTNTLSEGLISGVHDERLRDKFGGIVESSIPALQTTAAISQGSSGGPLMDVRGEVVGITTAYLGSGQGLNFAVPIREIRPLLKLNRGAHKRFGVGTGAAWCLDEGTTRLKLGLKLGDIQGALQEFEFAATQDPFDAMPYILTGEAYVQMGEYHAALRSYRRAIRLWPDAAEAWRGTAWAQCKLEQIPQAIAAYQHVIALQPDDAGSYYNMGTMHRRAGDKKNAVIAFQNAYRIDPTGTSGSLAKIALKELVEIAPF